MVDNAGLGGPLLYVLVGAIVYGLFDPLGGS